MPKCQKERWSDIQYNFYGRVEAYSRTWQIQVSSQFFYCEVKDLHMKLHAAKLIIMSTQLHSKHHKHNHAFADFPSWFLYWKLGFWGVIFFFLLLLLLVFFSFINSMALTEGESSWMLQLTQQVCCDIWSTFEPHNSCHNPHQPHLIAFGSHLIIYICQYRIHVPKHWIWTEICSRYTHWPLYMWFGSVRAWSTPCIQVQAGVEDIFLAHLVLRQFWRPNAVEPDSRCT